MFSKFRNLFLLLPIIKFRVEEESMLPTLKPGEIVFINRTSYLFNKPKISDIVVFQNRKNKLYFIKRITNITKDKFFVAGDNHSNSKDFGPISRNDILGKVILL